MSVGQKIVDRESQAGAKIPRAGLSPLSNLWATTGLPEKVSDVSNLFPPAGFAR